VQAIGLLVEAFEQIDKEQVDSIRTLTQKVA